jgi:hypothetical protein
MFGGLCLMPVLSNPRHERFAQELAKGKTQAEAYAEAGYTPSEPNASRLTSNDKVAARVAEIQDRAAIRCEITVAGLTADLLRLAGKAEKMTSESGVQASRACLMDAAKLNGLVVEKVENRNTNETALTDAELTAIASAGRSGSSEKATGSHGADPVH